MNKTIASIVAVIAILVVAWLAWLIFSNNISAPVAGNPAPAATSTAAAQGHFPPTQVIVYKPAPPASSTPVKDGSCWTNSIAAPFRADAWRCAVGNSIEDPCFEIPGVSKEVLCGTDPARPNATSTFVLRLPSALPPPQAVQGTVPTDWAWLVKLSDGTLCSPFTGTLPFTATGETANYGCAPKAPGAEGPLIFGDFTVNDAASGNGNTLFATVGMLTASTSGPPTIASSTQIPVATIWQ